MNNIVIGVEGLVGAEGLYKTFKGYFGLGSTDKGTDSWGNEKE